MVSPSNIKSHLRIRIGTQSAFSAAPFLAPFQYATENGFEAFEWLPDKKESEVGWEERDVDIETRRYIKETAIKHDIQVSVHAPWDLNPAEPGFENRLSETIEFAEEIGASLLNMHLFTDQGIDAYIRGILPVAATLSRIGMALSVENTPLTRPKDFNAFFRRLKYLAPEATAHVGMCLDIGHANLCGTTLNDYLGFIDRLKPHVPITHVHLHENYGDFDSHLTVFTGPAKKDERGIRGFVRRMKKRAFSGSIILEQWPDPPSLLNEARDRLQAMFGNTLPIPIHGDHIPTDDFVAQIVRANRQYRSWRQRLSWIRDILDEQGPEVSIGQLAYLAIYLRFMGTGQVSCVEDGRHYRPSHHAKIAQNIFDRLAKATTPENALVIGRIYPWLPSFRQAFCRAEPLTRIRDIAHRNDIPEDLKKEIKHTLQNKLHRCAGPEDMATSAALLKKITASHNEYSTAFVEAFKAFHEQLKEFFNARSVDQQLHAMVRHYPVRKGGAQKRTSADKKTKRPSTAVLIERFLAAKQKAASFKEWAETFEKLTALRGRFHEKLEQEKGSRAQQVRTAELGLEDFSFSLMSQLANHLQAGQEEIPWPTAIRIIELAVSNLGLSQFHVSECHAIESELAAWRHPFEVQNRQHILRLQASLDRCRRLAQTYCKQILSLFVEKAQGLGLALGVSVQAIDQYCEADIRSHMVFQLSRALDILYNALRKLAKISRWDVIVSGKASGWLTTDAGAEYLLHHGGGPVISLQESIEEDEAMPETVVGVVAAHSLPHLSHLAIRLRHRRIPCVVCEDKDRFARLKDLAGKWVSLDVTGEQVTIAAGPKQRPHNEEHPFSGAVRKMDPLPITLCSEPLLLPLHDVEMATGGGKAYRARKLKALSARQEAGFQALGGCVIPFGVMETALKAHPSLERAYRAEVSQLHGLQEPALSTALEKLRQIVAKTDVPPTIIRELKRTFPSNEALLVRSSANCEDWEKTATAGLYSSIIIVSSSDVAHGVRLVWASLWNKRAVMARARIGIAQEQAHMAVLIQPLLSPEYAFVIHTANPFENEKKELYVELAVGLGEPLASGKIPGSPYRVICNTHTGEVRMLAFASFSCSVQPGLSENLVQETIDYSKIHFSTDQDFREGLIRRLANIGRFVETSIGGPQDIEGVIQKGKVYLVQTRPQSTSGGGTE